MRKKPNFVFIGLGILLLAALALPLAFFFWPVANVGTVSVRLICVTNDATGTRLAMFSATNQTKRLFVRGHSEIEVQGNASNEVKAIQIRKVDFLKPGQCIIFSVRSPAAESNWRLNFLYMGQLSFVERLKQAFAWFLHDHGVPVPEKRLRLTPVRNVTTEWVHG